MFPVDGHPHSDTTSRIFGVDKKTAFQKLAKGDPGSSIATVIVLEESPDPFFFFFTITMYFFR